MNSEELQIQAQEQEQEPVLEVSDNLEAPNPPVEVISQNTDNETVEAQAQLSVEEQRVAELRLQEQQLRQQISDLQAAQVRLLLEQAETQAAMARFVQESLTELEQRKQTLQIAVEQLERRRERIREEMRKNFAGVSQELAIRVQGFKDYLVGSLQDLAAAAEQLDLVKVPEKTSAPLESDNRPAANVEADTTPTNPKFLEQQSFQATNKQIRGLLDQYRTRPDYYGPPWQVRRTFEPVHAERVSNWFFTQGGRGAIRSMGSRLQNILIGSAVISVLHKIYGSRLRTLVLANTPERLGEWRRGLQDCLGITRTDFGPERGVVLFEEADPLVQKAERLVAEKQMPLILIDETEDQINLSLLQFPLWLAFAPIPGQISNDFRF